MDIPERKEKKEPSNTPNIRLDSGFVVTGVFRRVREAIETGETPVLLIGVGGSGKTTLLMALADEWAKAGRNLIFLSLYDTGRGLNPLLELNRLLAKYSQLPGDAVDQIVAASSRAPLRATMTLIDGLTADLLIVFDGLDAIDDQLQVSQLLEVISRSTRAKIVASSRFKPEGSSRFFRSIFEITRFSKDEIAEYLRRVDDLHLDQRTIDIVTQISEGSPLTLSLVLEYVRRNGIPSDLQSAKPIEALVRRLVERFISQVAADSREEYFAALTSLAILNREIHASEYPATILQTVDTHGLINLSSNGLISFVHTSIREGVLAQAGLTEDSSKHFLSSLQFGAEEAERDALLSDSFISLPEFFEVVVGKKNIIIGDRGTGKSAMFSHLSTHGDSLKVTLVKPLTHPADMLRRLEANGRQLSTADQFRAGWLTLVAYCIADQVKTFSSPAHARAAIYLKDILGSESQTGWVLFRFFKGLADRILQSSVKIKLGPVEIDPAGKPGPKGASSI
jgi:hypothetical protein